MAARAHRQFGGTKERGQCQPMDAPRDPHYYYFL